MKVIGVITVVISISAILSYNHGVPTLGSGSVNKIEAITTPDRSINTTPLPANVNGMGLNPPHGSPGHRCDIAVGQPLSSKPATQPSTAFNPVTIAPTPANNSTKPFRVPVIQPAAGLNPPHGQPGHRCDLRVGQPLDSKPATQPSTVFNPVTNAPTPTSNPTKPFTVPIIQPAAGLNPPHGQPGHRCDIRVGQPLDSKPFTTIPTTNSTPTTNSMAVASGLNPKHGQPGHRCDIRVGQPLNSKPFTTTPTTKPNTPWTNSKAVASGLNPKHGQPGHRCDILVGQPLNSKPAQTSLQTNQ